MPDNYEITSVSPVKEGTMLYSMTLSMNQSGGQVSQEQRLIETLLGKISQSDEAALAAFYDATVNRVYALAIRITTRPELAEEVVNDVYIQVWRQAMNYNANVASPMAWLMMLCRSRSLDRLRREKVKTARMVAIAEQPEIKSEDTDSPDDLISTDQLSSRVSIAIKCLNEAQQEAITLAFYRDMSHREISEHTGVPLGTVKTNIRRAQAILRNALSAEGGEQYANL